MTSGDACASALRAARLWQVQPDSDEHSDKVLALALQLRRDRIDARHDQFEQSPPQGGPLWCARQIFDSNYVLLVCTKSYRDRFLSLEKNSTRAVG
jgi:hypothetical protein